jgi:hypothetical protein
MDPYPLTRAALHAYDTYPADGEFGIGLTKAEVIDLDYNVREALWLDSGGDPEKRDTFLAMRVEEVRRVVDPDLRSLWYSVNVQLFPLRPERDANGEFADDYTRQLWEMRHRGEYLEAERVKLAAERRRRG